jgi:hypothetical protein
MAFWLFIVAMVLSLTYSVVGAVTESPWYLLYALVPALLLTSQWYLPVLAATHPLAHQVAIRRHECDH